MQCVPWGEGGTDTGVQVLTPSLWDWVVGRTPVVGLVQYRLWGWVRPRGGHHIDCGGVRCPVDTGTSAGGRGAAAQPP